MTVSPNFSNFAGRKVNHLSIPIFFLFFILGLTNCNDFVPLEDDATPYIVNFTFSKPSATTATNNQYMPIDIRFDRNPSGYIHSVKVEIVDDKDALVEKIFESHVHTFKTYTYSQTNAFKPLNAGSLKIKATTTDENGKQENIKLFAFTVK
jgi:hypothetical protein